MDNSLIHSFFPLDADAPVHRSRGSGACLLVVLITLQVADIVLGALLFDVYGTVYAQYLNLSCSFLQAMCSTLCLLFLHWRRRRKCTPQTATLAMASSAARRVPWYILVLIGLCDGFGNWFMAVGMPHTAGLTQSIMLILQLPLVMLLSFIFLRHAPSAWAAAGGILVVMGTLLSAMRDVIAPASTAGGIQVFLFSTMMFGIGQIALSVEFVFEEHTFTKYKAVAPLKMFCVTMWVQNCLYWVLLPTQMIDALGGIQLVDMPAVFWDGVKCTAGLSSSGVGRPVCSNTNTILFLAYITIDFSVYLVSLIVIQRGSANVMIFAQSVALPLQQVVYCAPFLGKYKESIYWTDWTALAVVCLGFVFFLGFSREGRQGLISSYDAST